MRLRVSRSGSRQRRSDRLGRRAGRHGVDRAAGGRAGAVGGDRLQPPPHRLAPAAQLAVRDRSVGEDRGPLRQDVLHRRRLRRWGSQALQPGQRVHHLRRGRRALRTADLPRLPVSGAVPGVQAARRGADAGVVPQRRDDRRPRRPLPDVGAGHPAGGGGQQLLRGQRDQQRAPLRVAELRGGPGGVGDRPGPAPSRRGSGDTEAKLYDASAYWRDRCLAGTYHSGDVVTDRRSTVRTEL